MKFLAKVEAKHSANPRKLFSREEFKQVGKWVANYERLSPEERQQLREILPQFKPDTMKRLVGRLSGKTKHKSINGETCFLLYRGARKSETTSAIKGSEAVYSHRTSWSPDIWEAINTARALGYAGGGLSEIINDLKQGSYDNLLVCWIPISAIVLAPFFLQDGETGNFYAAVMREVEVKNEWEVVVAPGTFKLATYSDAEDHIKHRFGMSKEALNRQKREDIKEWKMGERFLKNANKVRLKPGVTEKVS